MTNLKWFSYLIYQDNDYDFGALNRTINVAFGWRKAKTIIYLPLNRSKAD